MATPIVTEAIRRKKHFKDHKPIPYDALQDPALQEFFARSNVQKHLMKNGWFASYATCASCARADKGPIKLCTECQRFFHISCLPTSPLTSKMLSVMIIHCTSQGVDVSPVKEMLMATGHFTNVDVIDVKTMQGKSRNHDFLKGYDSVFVMALNTEPQDLINDAGGWPEPDALGDLLADFVFHKTEGDEEVESGRGTPQSHHHHHHQGGIVLAPLTHWETIGGKWRKFKLSPLLPGRQKYTPHLVMENIGFQNHAVLVGVNKFAGGDCSYHVAGAVNETGAKTIARWSNGLPLVVVLDDHPNVDRGRVISLNFNACPSIVKKQEGGDQIVTFWDTKTDGATLLSNALRFVAHPTYQTEEGDLMCHDCETGTEPKKYINKAYDEVKIPQIKRVVRGQPYKDAIDETNHLSEPSKHKMMGRERDRAVADLHTLKERFRKKFREQISFSENRKHHVHSKLEGLPHKPVVLPHSMTPAPTKMTKPKSPEKPKEDLPVIEPMVSNPTPKVQIVEPEKTVLPVIESEEPHKTRRPKPGENASKRQELIDQAKKVEVKVKAEKKKKAEPKAAPVPGYIASKPTTPNVKAKKVEAPKASERPQSRASPKKKVFNAPAEERATTANSKQSVETEYAVIETLDGFESFEEPSIPEKEPVKESIPMKEPVNEPIQVKKSVHELVQDIEDKNPPKEVEEPSKMASVDPIPLTKEKSQEMIPAPVKLGSTPQLASSHQVYAQLTENVGSMRNLNSSQRGSRENLKKSGSQDKLGSSKLIGSKSNLVSSVSQPKLGSSGKLSSKLGSNSSVSKSKRGSKDSVHSLKSPQ